MMSKRESRGPRIQGLSGSDLVSLSLMRSERKSCSRRGETCFIVITVITVNVYTRKTAINSVLIMCAMSCKGASHLEL